jgi:hypothetical protein
MTQFLTIALFALLIAPACGDVSQPANADLGTGRILAQLLQCGSEDEDHKDCSREGRQSPAGGWVFLAECEKGSRECFPEETVQPT